MALPTSNPFYDIFQSLQGRLEGYDITADPNQPDRYAITNPAGLQMNVSARPSVEPGQSGRTWMVGFKDSTGYQGKVIQPSLYGTFQTRTPGVAWEGKSSASNLANIVHNAFIEAGRIGADPNSVFQRYLNLGNADIGLSPAPTVPYSPTGPRPASERKQIGSVSLGMRTDIEGMDVNPDQSYEILMSLQSNLGRVGAPGFTPTPIDFTADPSMQGRGGIMTWQGMHQMQMMLNDKGNLIPHVASMRPPTGGPSDQWLMPNDPSRYVKAPNLTAGVDTVSPYNIINGHPVPMQPGVTTNQMAPNYAYSNVLLTGETTPRAYERRSMVFDVHAVPGSATAYKDTAGVNPAFWGRPAHLSAPISGVSLYDLASGEASINLKNITHPLGGGVPRANIGTLNVPGQDPEDINLRLGPSIYRHQSYAMYIPKYINKNTGLPADFDPRMLTGDNPEIITTDALIPGIRERQGMPVFQEAGTGMGIRTAGTWEGGSSIKALDVKAAEYPTGTSASINYQGLTLPVSHFTGELKGTGFAMGFLGGLNPRQMSGLMRDFSKTFEGGDQFLRQYNALYRGVGKKNMPMNLNLDILAEKYMGITGQEGITGQGFAAMLFQNTIAAAEPGSAANLRNLKQYGAGYVPGTQLPLGIWNPEQVDWLKGQWARAQQAANPDITQEQINANWNERFTMRSTLGDVEGEIPELARQQGYGELVQTLSNRAMYMNMLVGRRAEYPHGSGASFEFLSGISENFPEFARTMGMHVESLGARGPKQRAAIGALQYAAFEGQRREQYYHGEGLDMPTQYHNISAETLQDISAYVKGAGKDVPVLEQLKEVRSRYLKDMPSGVIGWNAETRSFIPNPEDIQESTFKELGITAAGSARPYMKLLENLGDVTNPDYGLSEIQMAEGGIEASSRMFGYTTGFIGGSGEFFKRVLSRSNPAVIGGRMAFNPSLALNERWVPPELAKATVRRMGFRGSQIKTKLAEIMESGAQMLGSRYPMLAQGATYASNALRESTYQGRIGEERYQNIYGPDESRFRLAMGAPGVWGQFNAGDFDFDPYIELMGVKRGKGGNLEFLNDPTVNENMMTMDRANQEEAKYFADEKFRNLVNAQVKQLRDFAAGGKIEEGVVGKALAGNKSYDAYQAVGTSVGNMLSKMFGMGLGYNPRRGALGIMSSAGYSPEDIAYTLSTVPTFYQPALDKLLAGKTAGGVHAAAALAKSYFGIGDEGQPFLKIGGNSTTRREVTRLPDGTILPEIKSGGVYLPASGPEGIGQNRMAMLAGTGYMVEQFARGGELVGGGNARMSAEQVASWFALPGERDILKEQMGEDPREWAGAVQGYYRGIISGPGNQPQEGFEQIYQTPAWGTALTNAASKAINRTRAGETNNMMESAKSFFREMSSGFGATFRGAIGLRDIGYRGKGMNLRGIRANAFQTMMQQFDPGSIAGRTALTLSRMLGIGPKGENEDINFTSWTEAVQAQEAADRVPESPPAPTGSTAGAAPGERVRTTAQRFEEARGRNWQPPHVRGIDEEEAPPPGATVGGGPAGGEPPDGGNGEPPEAPPFPAEPPGGGGRRRRPQAGEEGYLPEDVRRTYKLAKRVGTKIWGIYQGQKQYFASHASIESQLEPILTEMGFGPTTAQGEGAGTLRQRLESAFQQDPRGLLKNLGPALTTQMAKMKGSEEQINMMAALMNDAHGLAGRRQEMDAFAADPRVRKDINIAGWFNQGLQSAGLKAEDVYTKVDAESWNKLSTALKNQERIQKELTEATDSGNKKLEKRLTHEKALADLEVNRSRASMVRQTAEGRLATLSRQAPEGGYVDDQYLEQIGKLQKQINTSTQAEMEAGMGIREVGGSKWGRAARNILGGFGLMYMRSIFGVATSGLGYGQQQAQAMQEAFAQGQYAFTGQAGLPYNQQLQLQNQMAVQGTNYNAVTGIQQFAAQNPALRDMWTLGSAGVGAFGLSSWMGSKIGGAAGTFMEANAPILGLGAAGLALAGDVYGRMQDPRGLGQRLGRAIGTGPSSSMPGFSDLYAWGGLMLQGQGTAVNQQGELTRAVTGAFNQGGTVGELLGAQVLDMSRGYRPGAGLMQALGLGGAPAMTSIGNQADIYSQVAYELQARNLNWTNQTSAATAGFLMRTPGMKLNDPRLQQIGADYQMGGWGATTAQQMLQVAGFSSSQLYEQQGGISRLSQAQLDITGMEGMDEGRKATITAGLQYASQLEGTRYISGLGAGQRGNTETRLARLEQLGSIAGTPAGNIFAAQQKAWYETQRAGGQYAQPTIPYVKTPGGDYAPQQYSIQGEAQATAEANAAAAAAMGHQQIAQGFWTQSAGYGLSGVGQRAYSQYMGMPYSERWRAQRLMSGDAMMFAAAAVGGTPLGQIQGLETVQGAPASANLLAMADTGLNGRLTGLNWGRTSLRLGDLSSQQMGANLLGQLANTQAGQAAIGGEKLWGTVTTPSGQQISTVGGTMGLQMYGARMNYDYQMAQLGLQKKGLEQDYTYQMQLWGLQDQQRALGFGHQMRMFGFQEQGMALQQQGFEQQNQNWWANFGINQRQSDLQRQWTREDWSFNRETRNMQWGWTQEDFQENRRFMTGRERRLAERSMERQTIMFGREGEQIDRQQARQEELWGLEDERFDLQKKQHKEQYELTKRQFELQKKQFEEQKKFFLENKKIEDEIIALQRKHWLEQHKIQEEQIKLTEDHAKKTLELEQVTTQLQLAMELVKGEANTLADDTLQKVIGALGDMGYGLENIVDLIKELGWDGQGSDPGAFGGERHGGNQPAPDALNSGDVGADVLSSSSNNRNNSRVTVVVNIGNEQLDQHIVDAVKREV